LWKRKHRRVWKSAGDKYWLSDWKHKTPEERKAYFRAYMREYRKKRTAAAGEATPGLMARAELAAPAEECRSIRIPTLRWPRNISPTRASLTAALTKSTNEKE